MITILGDFLINLSSGIVLVPLLILIYRKNGFNGVLNHFLMSLLLVEFVTEVLCFGLAVKGLNNYPVIHVYTLLYAVLLTLIYFVLLRKRWVLFPILIVGFTFSIEFFFSKFQTNTVSYILLCGSGILFSIAYFFSLLNNDSINQIRSHSLFWINSAVLFYFGTTLCLTLFENYIHFENPEINYYIWPIQLIANIIYHLMLSRGIWLTKRT